MAVGCILTCLPRGNDDFSAPLSPGSVEQWRYPSPAGVPSPGNCCGHAFHWRQSDGNRCVLEDGLRWCSRIDAGRTEIRI